MFDSSDPAFPVMSGGQPQYFGMTLRDYFAAKAMHAIIPINPHEPNTSLARISYEVADAMLAARSAS